MKDGMRFVDCDMHIMEPQDLFDRYLDASFKDRVSSMVGADGASRANWYIDGVHPSEDTELSQYRKPIRPNNADASILSPSLGNLTSSRLVATGRMDFALDRKYNEEAQVMGMEMEGIDIAVLFPTSCLNLLARDGMDPHLSYALCRAYNDWLHEFCQYSPDQMKFAAMLPVHDVNMACRELVRAVTELGAVGSFIRPNLINGHYWHSNYWDPLYSLHEELDVTWGFHEGTGPWYSYMNRLYGENQVLPACGESLDRDAAGDDCPDHRRGVRVSPESEGRVPGSAELLGPGASDPDRVGLPKLPGDPRAISVTDAQGVLPEKLLGSGRRV